MNLRSLGLCAALATTFVIALAEDTPAARVEAWLSALVAGDPAPLRDALFAGLLPERVAVRYHPSLRIRDTDPEGFRQGFADGLDAALGEWARAYRGSAYAVLSTDVVSATETAVVARIQTERERQYLRFIFQEQDGQPRLADIRLPLLGTDLESMMVDAVTNRPGPKARKALVDLLVWVGRALFTACVVVGLFLLARSLRPAQRDPRRAAGALVSVLVGMAGWASLGSALPRVSPQEQDIWLRRERIALTTAYLSRGDYTEAERLAREFLSRWPEHPRGTLLLAQALYWQKRYDAAEPLYHSLLGRGLYRELAHQQLARIAEARNDPAAAAVHLAAVVGGLGPDPALLVEWANDQLLARDVAAASATLTRAIAQEPGNRLAHEARARAALRAGDRVAAAADLAQLRRLDPSLSPETLRAAPDLGPLAAAPRCCHLFAPAPP